MKKISVRKYEKQNFTPEQEKATADFNDCIMTMLSSYGFTDTEVDEITEHIWNELDSEVIRVIKK